MPMVRGGTTWTPTATGIRWEGYGNVWVPGYTNGSFDPYGNGYWANYPGWGYTWISAYPWGWLPYHCGAWNYFDAVGWGWIPGECGLGWSPVGHYMECTAGLQISAEAHPQWPYGSPPG